MQILFAAKEEKKKSTYHAHSRGSKAIAPTHPQRQVAAGKRSQKSAHTDSHEEDGVSRIAP
jgi:hypothetical protein